MDNSNKKQCPHCKGYFAPQGYARWHGDNCVKRHKQKKVIPYGGILTLIVAFNIAAVAAWYSILGLTTIFAGAAVEVAIMATSLEIGKLVTAGWLHFRWNTVPILLKSYLISAVLVLMFITSIGVFGFLSKAHIEQSIKVGGNNNLQIQNYERRIANEQRRIKDAETIISQMDAQVQALINFDRIRGVDGAVSLREKQMPEREALNSTINDAYDAIERMQTLVTPLKSQQLSLEAEVGPLKYIAALMYGNDATEDQLNQSVRWLIILLVLVMDPLAVLLTIAGLMSFKKEEIVIVGRPLDPLIL